MDNKHMVSVVERYMDAFNEKDISIIRDMYADDAVVEDPVGTEPHVGIDAIRKFYEVAVAMTVEAELTGPVRVAGQECAFPFQVKVPDAGIRYEIIDVFRFDDAGKVCSMRAFWGDGNLSSV